MGKYGFSRNENKKYSVDYPENELFNNTNIDIYGYDKISKYDIVLYLDEDKNCKNILILMTNDPFCYPPSYEKISGDLSGLYSRRINRQHRIVYEVDEEKHEIHIIRMWTHYDTL